MYNLRERRSYCERPSFPRKRESTAVGVWVLQPIYPITYEMPLPRGSPAAILRTNGPCLYQKGNTTLIPIPRPEYPRPQFRRKDWTNLNGEWSFAFDDPDAGLANGW